MLQRREPASVAGVGGVDEETYRWMVEVFAVPSAVIDSDTTVRLWNAAAERLFGWSASVEREVLLPEPDPPVRDARDVEHVLEQREQTLDVAPPAAEARAPVAGAASVQVLIVEDNRDAAESLALLLELFGHEVRMAHDGLSALDVAAAAVPDVVLVDIGLPGIDGYELARRFRADDRFAAATLVALTGYGRDDDQRRALAAGFDRHLVKPVAIDALEAILDDVATQRCAGTTAPGAAGARS